MSLAEANDTARENGGGAIVNIASNHNAAGAPDYEVYAGTKGAIVAMTRSMAWSLAPQGVRINSLSPGLTMTEGIRDLVAKTLDLLQDFNRQHATGTFNTVAEVGRVAVFFAQRCGQIDCRSRSDCRPGNVRAAWRSLTGRGRTDRFVNGSKTQQLGKRQPKLEELTRADGV